MQGYTYTKGEHYPMEHLVFKVAPEDVERYLEVDHEIWTLKEAYAPGFDHRQTAARRVRGSGGGDHNNRDVGVKRNRLGGIQRLAAPDTNHHIRPIHL